MKVKVSKANKRGTYRIYLPRHIGEVYEGESELLPNALTLTIVRPGATLEQVRKSLQIILKDINLRLEIEGKESP